MNRAYFDAKLSTFLKTSNEQIIGSLTEHHRQNLVNQQTAAWIGQIEILREKLPCFSNDGHIFFEFMIPRMGRRADCVLVINGIIFVLEFKIGASSFNNTDREQTSGYALDLKHFHQGSHDKLIVPILIASNAEYSQLEWSVTSENVASVICLSPNDLSSFIRKVIDNHSTPEIDPINWANSKYLPTPTIIEAAQALYAKHNVEDISRSEAGGNNINVTSKELLSLIHQAREEKKKIICFVTGVPGAGKTLVGLNIANQHANKTDKEHAVFLSGNGPLVAVLQEALARDKSQNSEMKLPISQARRETSSFIQNIHRFRDESLEHFESPSEHVVIFDEAQRAWNKEQTAKFMQQKRGKPNFEMSEPEFLISVMDRHQDWAVVIALIGGGQEINTGEAGILGWFNAVKNSYSHWQAYCSPNLLNGAYISDDLHAETLESFQELSSLHLATSMRSFRAEKLSDFIHHLIDGNANNAEATYIKFKEKFPIVLTRDLEVAKNWIKKKTIANRRSGLLASANGIRLKAEGIFVKNNIEPEHWFLASKDDIRSSNFLEDAATEFDVQGLELDWTLVAWDADLRFVYDQFEHWRFSGSKWQRRNKPESKRYLENAYRVLLTRAREGMIIFVPTGDKLDETRQPQFYQGIADYLLACGIKEI
jgi:hypothetical protein